MNPERWDRIRSVVESASEMDETERTTFVGSADLEPADRTEVVGLLAALAEAKGFLEPIIPLGGGLGSLPDRVGPYRLARRIGEGGMGQVFLAFRADGEFSKQYAVKLLKPGLDLEPFSRRFAAEREILASLDHPGIARLYDAGSTTDGRAYLVMEHVDGEPIDAYCASRGLDLRRRLELFLKVCEAVSYLHRSLVVHRDLKPGNILVTRDGEPKLLDFGVAKLLASSVRAEGRAPTTGARGAPMTPEYASPEQLAGAPATTASDVFSLGVLLFELLTGSRFRDGRRSVPLRERGDLPPIERPSEVLRRFPAAGAEAPGPAHGLERIPPDLDFITLMALREEPERRYLSADRLAEDIRRYLANLPVAARPDALSYRVSKFIGRNRLWLGAAALLLGVVMTAAVALSLKHREVAAEKQRAEAVNDFLIGLFGSLEPGAPAGQRRSASEVLAFSAKQLETGFRDQPEVRAELQAAIGGVLLNLGEGPRAKELLEEALVGAEESRPKDLELRGRILTDLGRTELLLGELDPSLEHLKEARRTQRRLGDAQPQASAASATALGLTLIERVELPEAEKALREAVALAQKAPPQAHDVRSAAHRALGTALRDQARYSEARAEYLQALAALEGMGLHPEMLRLQADMAVLEAHEGDVARGEAGLRQVLVRYREMFPDGHPDERLHLSDLGWMVVSQGRVEEALGLVRQAVEVGRRYYGEDDAAMAPLYSNLAAVLRRLQRFDEAAPLLDRALSIYRRSTSSHPNLASTLFGVGTIRLELGEADEAVTAFRDAAKLAEKAYGSRHPTTLGIKRRWLYSLIEAGALDPARDLALEVERDTREGVGESDPSLGALLVCTARLARLEGRWSDAERDLERAETLLRSGGARHTQSLAGLLQERVNLLLSRPAPSPRVAEEIASEAVEVGEGAYPPGDSALIELRLVKARALAASGKTALAAAVAREACAAPVVQRPWAGELRGTCRDLEASLGAMVGS